MDTAAQNLMGIVGCSKETADYYAELAGGDAQKAVALYFDMGGAPPPKSQDASPSTKVPPAKKTFKLPDSVLPEIRHTDAKAILEFCASTDMKPPESSAKVYKSECAFTFDTPLSENGLYINLSTFVGVGKDFLSIDLKRARPAAQQMYLHEKWIEIEDDDNEDDDDDDDEESASKKTSSEEEPPQKKPKSIVEAIQASEKRPPVKKKRTIVLGNIEVPYPYDGIPDSLFQTVETLLHSDDSAKKAELSEFAAEEEIPVSKYAEHLVVEDNGVRVSPDPKAWVCADSGMTENLWLNLSDGYIGSGRRQYGGLGGTGAALRHYEEMKAKGKEYPLVVKLGTITAEGADVYSYAKDEDRAVKDPWLADHLAKRGINIMECVKTEMTTQEMELDASLKMDIFNVDADGKQLEILKGPGRVGLANLGNTCYMNSCLQLLLSIDEVRVRYASLASSPAFFEGAPKYPAESLRVQMVKLTSGLLLSDRYVREGSVRPRALKNLVGKGHPLFSTNKQQDALEFWQHLMSLLDREEKDASPANALFDFEVEKRLECANTHGVQYKSEAASFLSFNPGQCLSADETLEAASEASSKTEESGDKSQKNAEASSKPPPRVAFSACLAQKLAVSKIDGWQSPATGEKGVALSTYRIRRFPKYLVVVVWRWYTDKDWTAKKLNVEVEMPFDLDLEALRSRGRQTGESLLESPAAKPDPTVVSAVMQMGFSKNAGCRAALATKNVGAQEAVNWVLANMSLSDLNAPVETTASSSKTSEVSGVGVGSSKYGLVGLITHQGKNAGHGHYVCHARRRLKDGECDDGPWILFNDRKVLKPEAKMIPIRSAYIYLYKQKGEQ